ncbi:MAG: DNA-directed RNA polymerase subunit P [Candidatus Aenigmarchaeota archaeon]|nr:DNA-directed RNA polymerase subunit P [Candidatus Aenigmarchaeota archaeon]
MPYICMKCRKEFELEDRVRCPFCGFRILAKARPVFRKRVKAR